MLRDKIDKVFGKLDDEENQYFTDITKVEIDLPVGFGMASRRNVTVTEGYGSKAKKIFLSDVRSIHFDHRKYNWISVGYWGTTVNMAGSKGVSGRFFADEGELRIGEEEIGD